jgi:hypothetical protein
MATLQGSCLCGAIRYAAEGPLGPIGHCHCRTCRKAHGAAFATTARIPRAGFRWLSGESLLSSFESSPGKRRSFCSCCGSQLVAARDGEDELIVRLGCLDSDPGAKPVVHIWTTQKADWYELDARLPGLPRGAPRARSHASGADAP